MVAVGLDLPFRQHEQRRQPGARGPHLGDVDRRRFGRDHHQVLARPLRLVAQDLRMAAGRRRQPDQAAVAGCAVRQRVAANARLLPQLGCISAEHQSAEEGDDADDHHQRDGRRIERLLPGPLADGEVAHARQAPACAKSA